MAQSNAESQVNSSLEEVLGIIPPPIAPPESQGAAPGRGRLVGKNFIVVGGGQSTNSFDPNPPIGNGRATCILLAREGGTVVVVDRDHKSAQETADIITKEGIGKSHVIVGDVSTPEGCSAIVKDSVAVLDEKVDGLVIGVGIVKAPGSIKPMSSEYWDFVMNINLRSHFLLLQETLPYIEKQPEGGSAVSIGSVAAILPSSPEVAYHVSKAGLSTLVKNVAYQFAPKVRVNIVHPGLMDTPMGRFGGTYVKGRNASAVPLARQGTGWDIGNTIVWLMSGESSYISAQEIVVDGGRCGTGSKGARKPDQEFEVS